MDWILAMFFFFNKELLLVEFMFYEEKKKKGSITSRELRLHNPSHSRLSHQGPSRLEEEAQYRTSMKGIFVRALLGMGGGEYISVHQPPTQD